MENRETEKKTLNENEMEQAAGGFIYEGIRQKLQRHKRSRQDTVKTLCENVENMKNAAL